MAAIDKSYHKLLETILKEGYDYEDPNRKGVVRKEIPSYTFRHNLDDGFPALTTKKVFFKGAVGELLFFLSGSTDIRDLWGHGVNFWDDDWVTFHKYSPKIYLELKKSYKGRNLKVASYYDLGEIYPHQYRNFGGHFDQIKNLISMMRKDPMSTKLLVQGWNWNDVSLQSLPLCHYGFQVVCRPLNLLDRLRIGARLERFNLKTFKDNINSEEAKNAYWDSLGVPKYGFELHWQQRSTDVFLGTPINIQYYALLAHILERLTGHKALAIQGDLKNVHLYDNQITAAKEQLSRDVNKYKECQLEEFSGFKMDMYDDIDNWLSSKDINDFKLLNYKSYPAIKVDMLPYNK